MSSPNRTRKMIENTSMTGMLKNTLILNNDTFYTLVLTVRKCWDLANRA